MREAREALDADLDRMLAAASDAASNETRRGQVGSGMRGDKMRTYRFQEDCVRDHRTGRTACASKVMGGQFDLLWP